MELSFSFHKFPDPVYAYTIKNPTPLLLSTTIAALAWANSPWSDSYLTLLETQIFAHSLHHWINDGLMTIFFFVMGLEIKYELRSGHLASPKKASLAFVSAIGGMLLPAFIYYLFNQNQPGALGWGIPMATDIAFALGILGAIAGIPTALRSLLMALAIIDDLGAVGVIAIFYTSRIVFAPLVGSGLVLLTAAALARSRWANTRAYPLACAALGGILWLLMQRSGVHSTVAGVLLAFTVPIAGGTLKKIEKRLSPWVSFAIMPLFALANAGVSVQSEVPLSITHPVTLGIIAGLVLGKLLGISGFALASIKLGWSHLPKSLSRPHIFGMGSLGGIGFTMSLFIAGLAFEDRQLLNQAKIGILIASVISGLCGWLILRSPRSRSKT